VTTPPRSDLEPGYIIEQVQQLTDRFIVLRGDDELTLEATDNYSDADIVRQAFLHHATAVPQNQVQDMTPAMVLV
jgi:hypothetical protein